MLNKRYHVFSALIIFILVTMDLMYTGCYSSVLLHSYSLTCPEKVGVQISLCFGNLVGQSQSSIFWWIQLIGTQCFFLFFTFIIVSRLLRQECCEAHSTRMNFLVRNSCKLNLGFSEQVVELSCTLTRFQPLSAECFRHVN